MCHNWHMTDSLPSSSKRRQLRFDAGPYGPAFDTLCAEEGVKPQAMLRRLVAQRLADQQGKPISTGRVVSGEFEGPKRRMELKFTPSELKILDDAALRHGGSIRDFIISVARAHAFDAKVGKEERALLGQLNYQLLSIGRNVNQIAHRANAFDGVTQVQLSELEGLGSSLKSLSCEVHEYLLSGRERWKIVNG